MSSTDLCLLLSGCCRVARFHWAKREARTIGKSVYVCVRVCVNAMGLCVISAKVLSFGGLCVCERVCACTFLL